VCLGVERVRKRAIGERTIHPGARVLQSVVHIPGRPTGGVCGAQAPLHMRNALGGGRSTYASVSSHIELKGPYNARRRADIWLESVHRSPEGDHVRYLM
jgi:hypothetical protein